MLALLQRLQALTWQQIIDKDDEVIAVSKAIIAKTEPSRPDISNGMDADAERKARVTAGANAEALNKDIVTALGDLGAEYHLPEQSAKLEVICTHIIQESADARSEGFLLSKFDGILRSHYNNPDSKNLKVERQPFLQAFEVHHLLGALQAMTRQDIANKTIGARRLLERFHRLVMVGQRDAGPADELIPYMLQLYDNSSEMRDVDIFQQPAFTEAIAKLTLLESHVALATHREQRYSLVTVIASLCQFYTEHSNTAESIEDILVQSDRFVASFGSAFPLQMFLDKLQLLTLDDIKNNNQACQRVYNLTSPAFEESMANMSQRARAESDADSHGEPLVRAFSMLPFDFWNGFDFIKNMAKLRRLTHHSLQDNHFFQADVTQDEADAKAMLVGSRLMKMAGGLMIVVQANPLLVAAVLHSQTNDLDDQFSNSLENGRAQAVHVQPTSLRHRLISSASAFWWRHKKKILIGAGLLVLGSLGGIGLYLGAAYLGATAVGVAATTIINTLGGFAGATAATAVGVTFGGAMFAGGCAVMGCLGKALVAGLSRLRQRRAVQTAQADILAQANPENADVLPRVNSTNQLFAAGLRGTQGAESPRKQGSNYQGPRLRGNDICSVKSSYSSPPPHQHLPSSAGKSNRSK